MKDKFLKEFRSIARQFNILSDKLASSSEKINLDFYISKTVFPNDAVNPRFIFVINTEGFGGDIAPSEANKNISFQPNTPKYYASVCLAFDDNMSVGEIEETISNIENMKGIYSSGHFRHYPKN